MNYDSIAELVNKLVKNPKSVVSQENEIHSTKLKTNELTIIQNVFSKYEVSGDTLTISVKPLMMW